MKNNTSWHAVGNWYNDLVGDQGHYYHQHVVIPGVLRLLQLSPSDRLIDVACGQGVLSHHIPTTVRYLGLDAAKSLITAAQEHSTSPHHEFVVADATKPWNNKLNGQTFTHATCVLALQNMDHSDQAIFLTSQVLEMNGVFVLVLNHPCFRIPRQSSWEVDATNKLQYRRVNRYQTPLKIPIQMKPGSPQSSSLTWSFHQPLQYYFRALSAAGLVTETVEEWCSDKSSVGQAAAMENRARNEFPLFLAIKARKVKLV